MYAGGGEVNRNRISRNALARDDVTVRLRRATTSRLLCLSHTCTHSTAAEIDVGILLPSVYIVAGFTISKRE